MGSFGDQQRIAFAREFRLARAQAVRDAEAHDQILFALERLGSYLTRKQAALAAYKKELSAVAAYSHLFKAAGTKFPQYHLQFEVLYEEARLARNDAMHQGAAARHLARHAQELALVMEDALMSGARTAGDFMVPSPVCAEKWQPLSALRRTMLINAFSFLPFRDEGGTWRFVSDQALVRFTRATKGRDERLLMTLDEALKSDLKPLEAATCAVTTLLASIIDQMTDRPCLVLSKEGALVGIITAFDLL